MNGADIWKFMPDPIAFASLIFLSLPFNNLPGAKKKQLLIAG